MRSSVQAVVEVTAVFLFVIGVCRGLYQYRSIEFIDQTLPLWAAALFLYVPLTLLYVVRRKPEDWGIRAGDVGLGLKMVGLFALVVLPAFLLVYHGYRALVLHRPMAFVFTPDWPLQFLYHLLCIAFPEEVFYRGYMQSRLNERFSKPWRVPFTSTSFGFGWLYTGVLFAVGHFLIAFRWHTLTTFFPGLLFGWLRERTDSVLASTIFHALCNGLVLLLI